MDHPTWIIGHRNPDADAICSALGYEAYKHALGETHCRAARCGNSNARIDGILQRFGVPLPRFVGDVTPRVRDIMVKDVHRVTESAICSEALELMDRHDIRVLPVTDDQQKLVGSLSIFGMGEYFIPKPKQELKMREVYTSVRNIVRALNGEALNLVDADRQEQLFVRVGAMDVKSFGKHYQDSELSKRSVIVVGDRYDIQQRSIFLGVRLLIITGGLPVDEDVLELAKEKGVNLIVSPADSATTSWIVRSACRVDRVMSQNHEIFQADDKIAAVKRRIANSRALANMVVDDDGRLIGLFTKTDLLKPVRTNLILVDHNELSQAVPGADQVNIVEVVDHHRLGNPPTHQPILFINRPLGSTSTLVADLMQKDGQTPTAEIAGVLMGGIISDTLNLKGPTTTERDAEILGWLSGIAAVKPDALAEQIFNAGSVILSQAPEAVIRADMKTYEEDGVRYAVSQIEELGFDNFWTHHDALEAALKQVCESEALRFAALLVTDINTQNSLLLLEGDPEVSNHVTYPHRETSDVFELNGIVSRKKQLIPYLSNLVRTSGLADATAEA